MQGITQPEVLEAARSLMEAFATTNTDEYFSCFAAEATFIFYTEPQRLASRDDYRSLWEQWISEGWRVVASTSSSPKIQLAGSTAVFTHDVETVIEVDGEQERLNERESIIFVKTDSGEVLAIHEHLSPNPTSQKADV